MLVFPLALLLLLFLVLVLFVLPIWLLVSGVLRVADGRRVAGRIAVATVWLLFTAFALDSTFGPWHEKILDRGTAPDGRDYVLVQRFSTPPVEPFAIDLYVRSPGIGWVFHYVEHETFPWRSGGHVEFSDGTASVFCGSKLYKTIDLKPPETTDPYDSPRAPASLSAEDLFKELTR